MLVLDNAQLPYLEAHSTIVCFIMHYFKQGSCLIDDGVAVWYC